MYKNTVFFTVSIVLSLPFAIFHKEMQDRENTTICGADWPSQSIDKGATLAVVMTSYVIPLAAIIACYSRILLHLWKGGSNCNGRQTVSKHLNCTKKSFQYFTWLSLQNV